MGREVGVERRSGWGVGERMGGKRGGWGGEWEVEEVGGEGNGGAGWEAERVLETANSNLPDMVFSKLS